MPNSKGGYDNQKIMDNCTTYLDTIIHTERHNDDIEKFHTEEIKKLPQDAIKNFHTEEIEKLFEKDKKAKYWWENI